MRSGNAGPGRSDPPVSEHLWLEAAHAVRCGYTPGDPSPLKPGEPVPGCGCPLCTGISAGDPVRGRRLRSGNRSGQDEGRLPVEEARAVPILRIARILGLGAPVRQGREFAVRCPPHDDRNPSLRLNREKDVWYCDPCAIGGDGIRLAMETLRCSFHEAVVELAGG